MSPKMNDKIFFSLAKWLNIVRVCVEEVQQVCTSKLTYSAMLILCIYSLTDIYTSFVEENPREEVSINPSFFLSIIYL